MALASGQFTIIDLADIDVTAAVPDNPVKDQLWLDLTQVPNVFKRFDGLEWIVVTDQKQLEYLEGRLQNQVDTLNTQYTNLFNNTISDIYSQLSAKLDTTELLTRINQTAAGILLSAIQTIDKLVIGTDYKFDKDGLEIISTQSGVKIKIDNDEVTFSNLDGTVIVAQFTALMGALMSKIKVTGEAQLNNLTIAPVVLPGTNEKRTWITFNP